MALIIIDHAPDSVCDLEEFIKINTAPDVEPIDELDISRLRGLGIDDSLRLGGGGASGVVIVTRIA